MHREYASANLWQRSEPTIRQTAIAQSDKIVAIVEERDKSTRLSFLIALEL